MLNLNYCLDCQRIFSSNNQCEFCASSKVKVLKQGTSVNVIGTKSKGMFLKCKDGVASVVIKTEGNEKVVKEYSAKEIRKIL